MNIPKELLYTNDHEWLKVDGDKAYIGITDYAQHSMGDIVFVELPEVDTEIAVGESLVVIESVKAVSSVFSPISGTILEANEELEESPESLNEDPYTNYIVAITISNKEELKELLSADEYEKICKEEE
ncbi:MAG: glycine cleavage system protein GcvH [Syntrophomonadaceae bacterium]|nr:glycine cleavage system protein GcvH [Syntrophomonadaceae bacterium]MDD3890333.1 glycine cleavage system protein GcvH [Syntrophomonadaceae bacterium]MDD4550340.1 glycine cleavage system protein GcvH [Syntrophomonadaceae bacterium]